MPDAVNGVITITTAEQLAALAKNVNDGNSYSGQTIKLGSDIDLNGDNWTPIGTSLNKSFDGVFDGNGHTISNLTIGGSNSYVGLFGYNKGTVKNVTLTDVNVTALAFVGGLVGQNNNGGTVSGNTVVSTVSGDHYVGGLVGSNQGTVTGSTVCATVKGTDSVGGLAGWNNGTVTGNTVNAFVNGDYGVGGLVGFNGGNVTDNKFYSDKGAIDVGSEGTNNTRYYKLTLQGVSVTGTPTTITDGTTTYYAGTVTLTATDSDAVIKSTNYTNNADGTVSFTPTADTSISSSDIAFYYKLTLQGVTVDSGTGYGGNYSDYYTGTVTLAAKTGYVYSGSTSLNVTEDKTFSASLDTNGRYVFSDGNGGYTLATADNVGDYPDLTPVYALNLPEGVTVTGDKVATDDDGNTYAVGSVTLSAAAGYTLQNVTVDGTTYDGNTLTVNADTKISADSIKFNNVNISTATGATVGGTTGNLSTFNGVYSITASQQNSTLTGNAKNNTIILNGGGENILTGGSGNDTYQFSKGGGIVTDYGIGATKDSDGSTLKNPLGTDVIKIDGKVSGVYFDRDASSKKSATFTAVVTYGTGDDTQIIVLQNINKKPTKYSSDPSKAVYQTNDAAAATLKIWDTSGSKQAVLSASKLKALFRDDSELSDLSATVQTQLVKLNGIGDLNLPAVDQLNQTAQATFNGGDNG